MTIQMIDLQRQRVALEPGLTEAIGRVLAHGGFVGGPEVAELEAALAARIGVAHVVACANGTDALQLLLRAEGIGAGDAVFVPALTFAGTAEPVALAGAVPVFVDIDPAHGTMCPQSLAEAVAATRAAGRLTPRAVIAVDLFSLPADLAALGAVADDAGLVLFVDAAHSIGTDTAAGPCGSGGAGASTSFYPSKALGCYGDGGAVFVACPARAARVRAIANHGVGPGDPRHAALGGNSRLDTMQAAVLLEKLRLFDAERLRRRAIAAHYRAALEGLCGLPVMAPGTDPVWSYFAVQHPARDRLQQQLADAHIRSVVYYRTPLHLHPAFSGNPVAPGGLPGTTAFARDLLCLPLHPYMTDAEVERVIAAVRACPG